MSETTAEPHGSTGCIEVITGCMFAGKTETLLRRARRAQIAGQTVEAFTPAIDDRYGDSQIGSHDGRQLDATPIQPDQSGMDTLQAAVDDQTDVIVIDEANFFTDALVPTVKAFADDGHRVLIAGIDQTFRGDPFEPLPSLIVEAEYVKKLRAVCDNCGQPATRNQRLIDGQPAPADAPTIEVGGDERYEARCRDCHTVPGPTET